MASPIGAENGRHDVVIPLPVGDGVDGDTLSAAALPPPPGSVEPAVAVAVAATAFVAAAPEPCDVRDRSDPEDTDPVELLRRDRGLPDLDLGEPNRPLRLPKRRPRYLPCVCLARNDETGELKRSEFAW